MKGNLNIEVHSAEIIVDSETFTKMDTWVQIEATGQQMKRTKTIQSGGKTPQYNEKFSFPINDLKAALTMQFKIMLMKEDIKNHDELSSTTLNYPILFCLGEGLKKAPHYIYDKNGVSLAKIWLTITYQATEKLKEIIKPAEEVKQPVIKEEPGKQQVASGLNLNNKLKQAIQMKID